MDIFVHWFFIFCPIMNELEELYISVNYIFNHEESLEEALNSNLFDMDYIAVFTLLLDYYNLVEIPDDVIEICLKCHDLSFLDFDEMVKFISHKWELKANDEIDDIIYKIENEEEL